MFVATKRSICIVSSANYCSWHTKYLIETGKNYELKKELNNVKSDFYGNMVRMLSMEKNNTEFETKYLSQIINLDVAHNQIKVLKKELNDLETKHVSQNISLDVAYDKIKTLEKESEAFEIKYLSIIVKISIFTGQLNYIYNDPLMKKIIDDAINDNDIQVLRWLKNDIERHE